jgi:hypothetical protein
MYTPYNGTDFLKAYFKDRKTKITLNHKQSIQSTFADILVFLETDTKIISEVEHGTIITSDFLKMLLFYILNEEKTEIVYSSLSKIIKKYEVTKKLYSHYDKDWKGQENFQNIDTYVWLHLVCITYYSKFKNLKMLNCALKLGDFISSRFQQIEHRLWPETCFLLEVKMVEYMIKKSGVAL